jgi:hypothetical protein
MWHANGAVKPEICSGPALNFRRVPDLNGTFHRFVRRVDDDDGGGGLAISLMSGDMADVDVGSKS